MDAPTEAPLSALPSPAARAVAFVGICLAGLAGALIGYSLVELQCEGDCGLPLGLGILAGAVIAAGGMSIVAVLVLRALGEWRELDDARADMIDELAELACRLAVEAGDQALAGQQAATLESSTKSTATDLVTAHDRAAEATIVAGITAARPDDAIVGEEGTAHAGTSGVTWYVDPIDGTTNFVYGLHHWATSIAAADAEGTLVGAVYAPVLGELFAAARGRGATLDGRPIRCSDRQDLALALVATGFSYAPAVRVEQAAILTEVIGHARDIRRLGSAAIDLCHVACGRVDAYYEAGLSPWDAAAGELIAREAGCRAGDFAGGPSNPAELLVATPAIFDELAGLLAVIRHH